MLRIPKGRARASVLGVALFGTIGGASVLTGGPATAAPVAAVEDFAYPKAADVQAQLGVKVIAGDGNLRPVSCPLGRNVLDDLIRVGGRDAPNGEFFCFKATGPVGYLKLELPPVYNIETDGHDVDLVMQRVADGHKYPVTAPADDGTCPNYTPGVPGCWKGLGESDGGVENTSTVLEMATRPPDGSIPPLLPAQGAHAAVGRLTAGPAGRIGSGSCSATLVSPAWVLTAASCFGSGLTAGPPPAPTTVNLGGQTTRKVVHVVPRSDRDLVLAQLDFSITGIAPVSISSTAPAVGQSVTAKGLGRTATEWTPSTVHTAAAMVTAQLATTLSLASNGPICKGDAGGPVVGGGGNLLGVVTASGQEGCLAAVGTSPDAIATRVDTIADWIRHETRYITPQGRAIVARPDGEMNVAVRTPDNSLRYYVSFPGGHFGVVQVAGPGSTFSAPSLAVRESGEVNIVAQGPNNSLVYYKAPKNGPFTQHIVAGNGTTFSAPALAVRPDGQVNVVAQGPNNSLNYYVSFAGQTTFGMVPVAGNGSTFSAPALAVRESGEVNVVAQGPNNSLLYHVAFEGGSFSPLTVAGNGSTFSAPAIVVRPTGEANVVAQGPNNSLRYYVAWPGQPNFGMVPVAGDGTTFSTPAITVRKSGEVNVVAKGPGNSLGYYVAFPNGPFQHVPVPGGDGSTLSAPGLAVRANGEVYVVARGSDGALRYHRAAPGDPFVSANAGDPGSVLET